MMDCIEEAHQCNKQVQCNIKKNQRNIKQNINKMFTDIKATPPSQGVVYFVAAALQIKDDHGAVSGFVKSCPIMQLSIGGL